MCSSSSFYGLPREGSGVVEDEERFQGDLADMVRSISGAAHLYPDSSSNWTQPSVISDDNIINDHHHQHHHHQVLLTAAPPDLSIFHDQQQPSYVDRISSHLNADYLGSDPFSSILMGDPLLLRHRDGDLMMMMMKSKCLLVDSTGAQGNNNSTFVDRRLQEATKKCQPAAATNISTNLVTPAPPVSPRKEILFLKPAPASFTLVGGSEDVDHGSSNGMLNDNRTGSLGISPPRNPAIKRRKSLAKKVVCIPAPAPANSRPSGEVVPSDLWAWRKYGQKPIKGSPYPRGYYRCSSTKGCSARKQVERSRTNPNMLVITYTSEHNHPWPTQRNALAGSTRSHSQSQPSKNSKRAPASSNTTSWVLQDNNKFNAEKRSGEEATEMMRHSNVMASEYLSVSSNAFIKEELGHEDCSNQQEDRDYDVDDDCDKIYRPTTVALPFNQEQVEQSQDDFFSELGEIAGKDAFSYLDTAVI